LAHNLSVKVGDIKAGIRQKKLIVSMKDAGAVHQAAKDSVIIYSPLCFLFIEQNTEEGLKKGF